MEAKGRQQVVDAMHSKMYSNAHVKVRMDMHLNLHSKVHIGMHVYFYNVHVNMLKGIKVCFLWSCG